MAVLDIRTTLLLTIKSDIEKNFSITISGITNLDTEYTLTLSAQDSVVVKTVSNGGITLGANSMTIGFLGSEFPKTRYTGELESEDKDTDVYLRIITILELS